MTFDEYQEVASTTARYPGRLQHNPTYPVLGLNGEAGEVAEKLKKLFRDTNWTPGTPIPHDVRDLLIKELGDVLWYLSACCDEIAVTSDEVAHVNIQKLLSRKQRGVIGGSGDNR